MLFLDVVAESLAVIREHDDGRAIVEAALLQPREKRPDDLVGVGYFAVVGRQIAETVRRPIRFVRFIEMKKEEEAIGRQRFQPGLSGGQRLWSGSLHLRDRSVRGRWRKLRIVDVESGGDSGFRSENVRRHERSRLVARAAGTSTPSSASPWRG